MTWDEFEDASAGFGVTTGKIFANDCVREYFVRRVGGQKLTARIDTDNKSEELTELELNHLLDRLQLTAAQMFLRNAG
jgi:hypothetical protein